MMNQLRITNCKLQVVGFLRLMVDRATMDYRLWTIVFLLTTTFAHSQQNIVTAQYLYNGLLINPAYAGSHVQ
jgi:hypothetical protein